MAEDEKGWSEKGKRPGRAKREPKQSTDDGGSRKGTGSAGDASTGREESTKTAAPSRPSKRAGAETAAPEKTVVRARSEDVGARKVAKAAATAGQRDISFASRLGFPALIALICLLGIAVVFYAWTTREALATPSQADHWHAVYGVYDCTAAAEDKYVPPFQSSRDETGIHSHGDGLIHIHPFFELSSGDRAILGHFMDEMGIEITPDAITLDSGAQLVAGTECVDGSGPAEIRVLHWDFDFQATADSPPDPVVITDNFRDIKFENDREVYIIAFAGPDADIPAPPQQRFTTLNSVAATIEYNPTELAPRDTGVSADDDADGGLVPNDTGVSIDDEPADE